MAACGKRAAGRAVAPRRRADGVRGDRSRRSSWLDGFRQGLEKLGWLQGSNVVMDYRYAPGNSAEEVLALAKEIIALRPDVILASGTSIVAEFQRQTRTIPIVFVAVSDPIGSGFIESMAQPRGQCHWAAQYEATITGKWLSLLKEITPNLARAALMANPKVTAYDYFLRAAEATASSLGIELTPLPVENAGDVERVSNTRPCAKWRVGAPAGHHNHRSPRSHYCIDGTLPAACDLFCPRICHCRWAHVLQYRSCLHVSAGGLLC